MIDRSGNWGPIEVLLAALLGALIGAAAAAGLLGGVAGALFGQGWPHTEMDQLPSIAVRLPAHLGDPRRAWPEADQRELPGAAEFYVAAASMVLAAGLIAVGLIRAQRFIRGRGTQAGAQWATPADLKSLRVGGPEPGRLVIGRRGRRFVATEARQSVIVVAPTQTGKTTGLAVPAILEWDGPVLATSVKTDLVGDTFARRRQVGEVKVFDPTAVTGIARAQWTPLGGCGDWQSARETAGRLCSVAQPGRGLSDADFWTAAAARYLAPLLFAAARSQRTITDVVSWIDTMEHDVPRSILARLELTGSARERRAAHAAFAALESVRKADDRLRSSLSSTAAVALDAYGDPSVADSALRAELTADWLLSDRNTAYLCATATGQERLRPLFVTLIDQVVAELYERAARTGLPLDPPLLLVLDEAANIAPLPRLDQLAATGAGQGLQLVTVVQDLAQVEARWGRKADTILNNHRAKVFGGGISCEKTLSYLSKVLGETTVPQRSETRGESGRRSTTTSSTYRSLAAADRLRQSRPGHALLLYGHLPPAEIALRPWYADRSLLRLAAAEDR